MISSGDYRRAIISVVQSSAAIKPSTSRLEVGASSPGARTREFKPEGNNLAKAMPV
jgi:hypothetical protein